MIPMIFILFCLQFEESMAYPGQHTIKKLRYFYADIKFASDPFGKPRDKLLDMLYLDYFTAKTEQNEAEIVVRIAMYSHNYLLKWKIQQNRERLSQIKMTEIFEKNTFGSRSESAYDRIYEDVNNIYPSAIDLITTDENVGKVAAESEVDRFFEVSLCLLLRSKHDVYRALGQNPHPGIPNSGIRRPNCANPEKARETVIAHQDQIREWVLSDLWHFLPNRPKVGKLFSQISKRKDANEILQIRLKLFRLLEFPRTVMLCNKHHEKLAFLGMDPTKNEFYQGAYFSYFSATTPLAKWRNKIVLEQNLFIEWSYKFFEIEYSKNIDASVEKTMYLLSFLAIIQNSWQPVEVGFWEFDKISQENMLEKAEWNIRKINDFLQEYRKNKRSERKHLIPLNLYWENGPIDTSTYRAITICSKEIIAEYYSKFQKCKLQKLQELSERLQTKFFMCIIEHLKKLPKRDDQTAKLHLDKLSQIIEEAGSDDDEFLEFLHEKKHNWMKILTLSGIKQIETLLKEEHLSSAAETFDELEESTDEVEFFDVNESLDDEENIEILVSKKTENDQENNVMGKEKSDKFITEVENEINKKENCLCEKSREISNVLDGQNTNKSDAKHLKLSENPLNESIKLEGESKIVFKNSNCGKMANKKSKKFIKQNYTNKHSQKLQNKMDKLNNNSSNIPEISNDNKALNSNNKIVENGNKILKNNSEIKPKVSENSRRKIIKTGVKLEADTTDLIIRVINEKITEDQDKPNKPITLDSNLIQLEQMDIKILRDLLDDRLLANLYQNYLENKSAQEYIGYLHISMLIRSIEAKVCNSGTIIGLVNKWREFLDKELDGIDMEFILDKLYFVRIELDNSSINELKLQKLIEILNEDKLIRIDKKSNTENIYKKSCKSCESNDRCRITQFGSYKIANFVKTLQRLHRLQYSVLKAKDFCKCQNGAISNIDNGRLEDLFGSNFLENFEKSTKSMKTMLTLQNLDHKMLNLNSIHYEYDQYDMIRFNTNRRNDELQISIQLNDFISMNSMNPDKKGRISEFSNQIDTIVKKWAQQNQINDNAYILLTTGSHLMGAEMDDSDLDLICVVPNNVNVYQFYGPDDQSLYSMLLNELDDIDKNITVKWISARVSLIKLNYIDIDVDVTFTPIPKKKFENGENLESDEIIKEMSYEPGIYSLAEDKQVGELSLAIFASPLPPCCLFTYTNGLVQNQS